MSSEAARDLMNYTPSPHPPPPPPPPHTHTHNWVRAYFSRKCKSWVVDNNMVESFNSWILDARYMLIRTMMEYIYIRKTTMNMLGMKGSLCEKLINCYSPICNENF